MSFMEMECAHRHEKIMGCNQYATPMYSGKQLSVSSCKQHTKSLMALGFSVFHLNPLS